MKSPRVEISVSRRCLWFDQNQTLPKGVDLHDEFVGHEVERFCNFVGNQGEKFKTSCNPDVEAPMDFAIVTGWQVCPGLRDLCAASDSDAIFNSPSCKPFSPSPLMAIS